MVTYEDIKKANETIKTIGIERKDKFGNTTTNEYAEVNQRIKAFRMVYPNGHIETEMLSNENGVCVFRCKVGYTDENGESFLLGVGHAYEKENSTFINKTSFIENCETSAVGRALGMAGFGIDTSVASYEEVATAMANQGEKKASPKQVEILAKVYTGDKLEKLLQMNNVSRIEDISMNKASELIGKLRGKTNG